MAFPGTGKIWMNGSLVDWKDAKIHIGSHIVHYGSGVFEGARCYDTLGGSACFRRDAHIRRLMDSARIYRMEPKYGAQELTDAIFETINANGFRACYIRPIVYRGYDSLGVNPLPCPVDVAIMVWEWGAYFTKEAIEEGLDVKISTWARNVFIVRDGVIFTPPVGNSVLWGITRDSVMTLARELGFDVREQTLPRETLYIADEVFFAGTAVEVTPIRSVDRVKVGRGRRGPVTEAIQQRFFQIVKGELPDTHGWLQFVHSPATSGVSKGR